MQSILSIDVSSEPALVQVVQVNARSIDILESHQVALGGLFSRENIVQNERASSITESETTEGQTEHAEDSENGAQENNQFVTTGTETLAKTIRNLTHPWTTSVALIPTYEYLSLNLDLPFGDPKNLSKILDLEVQDRVPFDLSEFHLEHKSLSVLPNKSFDIHVGLMPKGSMGKMLALLRQAGVEPYIMSTPASILGALFYVAPDYFKGDAAVICLDPPAPCIAIRIDGHLRSERVLMRTDGTEAISKQALTELKLTLSAAETRYQKRLEHVFLVGRQDDLPSLQNSLGRNVESVDLDELIRTNGHPARLASLAGVFAQDTIAPPILTNFRTREFAYSPQLRELWLGLKRLLPYFGGVIALLLVSLVCIYFFRERQIGQLRSHMSEKISNVLPKISLEPGKEVSQVLGENFSIEQQLKDLGSPSHYSALDLLLEITRDFPTLADVSVRSVSIHGNIIKIDGTSQNYAGVENIQKALKASKTGYCRVEKDKDGSSVGGGQATRSFSFELRLCD